MWRSNKENTFEEYIDRKVIATIQHSNGYWHFEVRTDDGDRITGYRASVSKAKQKAKDYMKALGLI